MMLAHVRKQDIVLATGHEFPLRLETSGHAYSVVGAHKALHTAAIGFEIILRLQMSGRALYYCSAVDGHQALNLAASRYEVLLGTVQGLSSFRSHP